MYCLLIKTMKDGCLKSISSKLFNDFDEAYSELRTTLRELALTKTGVFDGQGNIKEMNKYFKEMEKGCRDEDWWSDAYMSPIKYINALVLNNELRFKPFAERDCMITWKYRKHIFELVCDNEGPINGVVPVIRTNIDSKNPEHCYFYVNDNFGGNGRDEYSVNELFVDLVKVE